MTNLELQWLYFKVCAHLVNCSVADSSNPQMIIIKILSILPSCGGTCGTLTLSLILSYFFKKVAHALNSQTTPTMTHMNEIFVVFQLDCTAFGRPACENIFNNVTTLPLTHWNKAFISVLFICLYFPFYFLTSVLLSLPSKTWGGHCILLTYMLLPTVTHWQYDNTEMIG